MAFKLLELKLVFIWSSSLFPLNSILIKYNPNAPKIRGAKKLKFPGKNPVKFHSKKVLVKTSSKPIRVKKPPIATKLVNFSF